MTIQAILIFVTAALSFLLTGLWRKQVVAWQLYDHANHRSSHKGSVPRSGGVVFCVLGLTSLAIMWLLGDVSRSLAMALLFGGGMVCVVGFLDDLKSLPAIFRICIHVIAGILAVICLSPLPTTFAGLSYEFPSWLMQCLVLVSIIWAINLWNFMDGIDGLAASQACVVLIVLSMWMCVSNIEEAHWIAVMAGLVGGFLCWNMSSSRFFMGDAGSGFLGFLIAVIILFLWRNEAITIWSGLILTAMMWVDSTVTLMRRLWRRQRPWEAHRTHAYQHMACRGRSHKSVALMYVALQVGILLPLAALASLFPDFGIWLAIGVGVSLGTMALWTGAGSEPIST